MIEQRRAALERVGHRRDVDLHQQVVRQIAVDVDIEILVQQSRLRSRSARAPGRRPPPARGRAAARYSGVYSGLRSACGEHRTLRSDSGSRGRARPRRANRPSLLRSARGSARRGAGACGDRRGSRARSAAGTRSSSASSEVGRVSLVAGEALVAAVAVERHRHVLAGEAGEVEATAARSGRRTARRSGGRASAGARSRRGARSTRGGRSRTPARPAWPWAAR